MPPRGRKGLTVRLSVCSMSMPSFVARIRALNRYRYAKDAPAARAIYQKYMDKIDDRYGQMDEADQKASGTSPRKRQRNTEPMSVRCGKRCILKSPNGAGNTTGSRKTKIWNDKEV